MVGLHRMVMALGMVAVASVSGTVAAPADERAGIVSFREQIALKAAQGIPYETAEIVCRTKMTSDGEGTGLDLVFIGAQARGAEIWAITGFDLARLAQLWTGGPTDGDSSTPPTQEWGWIYDRNGDGRTDWIAVVDSPRAVLPPDVSRRTLPNLFLDPSLFAPDEIALVNRQARVSYWHAIDSDFDGVPDIYVVDPIDTEIGWTEGAMWVSFDGEREPGCRWLPEKNRYGAERPCVLREGAFETDDRGPLLYGDIPIDYLTAVFDLVSRAADACGFGPEGMESRP